MVAGVVGAPYLRLLIGGVCVSKNRSHLWGRGVWLAPWLGPSDEMILVAVDGTGRMVAWSAVRQGAGDQVAVADGLWAILEAVDPAPAQPTIRLA